MDMGVEVTGVQENLHALAAADDINLVEGGHQAALALIPYLQSETRIATGRLRGGWQAQDDAFVNEIDYAGYQEYGTVWVTGTHAIDAAVSSHEGEITEAFERVTDDAIHKAGY